jgi:hypothetical protein
MHSLKHLQLGRNCAVQGVFLEVDTAQSLQISSTATKEKQITKIRPEEDQSSNQFRHIQLSRNRPRQQVACQREVYQFAQISPKPDSNDVNEKVSKTLLAMVYAHPQFGDATYNSVGIVPTRLIRLFSSSPPKSRYTMVFSCPLNRHKGVHWQQRQEVRAL